MGNNNRLAHRYGKKGLIILAGIWVLLFLAAAGETMYTRISVPAHHRTRANLYETKQSLMGVSLQLDRMTAWALCLQVAQVTGPQLGPIDFLDVPAKCSDPR
jgi:hypothetical protein